MSGVLCSLSITSSMLACLSACLHLTAATLYTNSNQSHRKQAAIKLQTATPLVNQGAGTPAPAPT